MRFFDHTLYFQVSRGLGQGPQFGERCLRHTQQLQGIGLVSLDKRHDERRAIPGPDDQFGHFQTDIRRGINDKHGFGVVSDENLGRLCLKCHRSGVIPVETRHSGQIEQLFLARPIIGMFPVVFECRFRFGKFRETGKAHDDKAQTGQNTEFHRHDSAPETV
ncbi:hypothetical protein KUH32_14880 [Thalassococcus sp. CAU 1522]|uniref:Uncharacterized protein n=1 Tax=Thalassococcus arenae TaxID=2851652 RepID=A0ABS6NAK8_9RHOB|nr:hypothetical protein [Thalassococcus arenae]MBV2361047.1 hypothetical protein [Thalassococcus arenae]